MEEHGRVPKYIFVQKDIISKIENKTYKKGDYLPTEERLCELYDMSRITIRKALENLAKEGYVTKIKGSGSIVNELNKMIKSPDLKSFTQEMREENKHVENKVISFNHVNAGERLAELLHIRSDEDVIFVERLRSVEGIEMVLARSYMSSSLHHELRISDLENGKFEYAKKAGFTIGYSDQKVEAVLADCYVANLLKIGEHEPIIKILNTVYLQDGSVFDYNELYLNPHHYQLSIHKKSITNI